MSFFVAVSYELYTVEAQPYSVTVSILLFKH